MDSHHFLNFLVATTEGILHKLYKHVLTIANISDTLIHPMQLIQSHQSPYLPYEGFHTWGGWFGRPILGNPHILMKSPYRSTQIRAAVDRAHPSVPGNRLPFVPFAQMLQHTLRICRVLALRGSRLAVLLGPNNSGKRSHGATVSVSCLGLNRDPLVI